MKRNVQCCSFKMATLKSPIYFVLFYLHKANQVFKSVSETSLHIADIHIPKKAIIIHRKAYSKAVCAL